MYNLDTDCSACGLVKLLWVLFQTPVVVDTDHMANDFDLITNNEHLHESEVRQECYGDAHSVITKTNQKNSLNPLLVVHADWSKANFFFNKNVYLKCFLACSKEKEKTLHARSAHWLQGLTKCQCQRGFCAVSHLRYSREKNSQLWLLSTSDRLCSQAEV